MEQEDLTLSEGNSVNLTIFYMKNIPLITLKFNILSGGNATGIHVNMQYNYVNILHFCTLQKM